MLNGVKIRSIYSKIQTQLFYMIPEKWDKIYLYASIVEKINNLETGEMFFYYYPKGILKKNPVNVYEIPTKFNIDENEYMKLVNKLYDTIKTLREEFEKLEERTWTNLTISIENFKFHVEYDYEDLLSSSYSSYDRHIIWKYKYLNFPIERFSKRDRQMLEEYLLQEQFKNKETKNHIENMYQKSIHNIIEYNKEKREYEEIEETKEKQKEIKLKEKSLDKYELYKRKKEEEKQKETFNTIEDEQEKKKNQILCKEVINKNNNFH